MANGHIPFDVPFSSDKLSDESVPTRWRMISERKKADREGKLNQFPEWKLREVPPETMKDVSNIPKFHLASKENEIVHLDATALVEAIRARRYTALEVTKAFGHAATIAQQLTNCLTEVFYDEAIKRAEELDKHLEETGEFVGPLHGLPFSIKDHVLVKGHDTSTGYAAWAYKTMATKDAVAVDILRKAGAVLYVKTANPQTLLSLETSNNIYGRTYNPFNRDLTPGGSSGGESALISLHGSPLGIGTDIGGSIVSVTYLIHMPPAPDRLTPQRIPAAHCGLYGLKGSVGRMPHAGLMGSHDGMDAIVGALGPIARSARDLALFCRVMLQYEPWLVEPPLIEKPWNQKLAEGETLPKKLSFAILWDDGFVKPHPPILDALKRAKQALIQAGHEVIDWVPVDHEESWSLITKLYFLDGGEEYRDVLRNDPPVPQTEWILSHVPNGGKPYNVHEIFKINLDREAFRAKIAAHWNATQTRTSTRRAVDAILSPVAPTLAPPHDSTRWWGYTSYWNLMDFSAAVFPMGRFSAEGYAPSDITADHRFAAAPRNPTEKFIADQWNPATYENAPISLQLVGRRLNEEKVLGMLQVVEDALRPTG
ncbi:amidase [Panus rudis PR-1116 ss-1]|nr:amidase [Panus rudis PR-1116 ss-1]